MNTHVVNRLRMELTCTDEDVALNLRHNFSGDVAAIVSQVIDEVCSRYAGPGETLRLDQLVIDMGSLHPNELTGAFPELFRYHFEKQLREHLSTHAHITRTDKRNFSDEETLHFFLQHGSLTWWAGPEQQPEMLDEEWVEKHKVSFGYYLSRQYHQPQIWKRMSMQFGSGFQSAVVSVLPALAAVREQYIEWIRMLEERYATGSSTSFHDIIPLEAVTAFVLANAPVLHRQDAGFISRKFIQLCESLPGPGTDARGQVRQIAEELVQKQRPQETSIPTSATHKREMDANAAKEQEKRRILEAVSGEQNSIMEGDANEDARLLVKSAGLVMLAPFIKELFTRVKLWEDRKWKETESPYRAVHLLGYVATAEEGLPEYRLLLEKILCGFHPEEPLPKDVKLTDEEKEEAENMLKAVIANWKALRNSSPKGLRETFLTRDGIIFRTETGWKLLVERKTLDVLMDSLPWSFTPVVFSWSDIPLFVEW